MEAPRESTTDLSGGDDHERTMGEEGGTDVMWVKMATCVRKLTREVLG